MVLTPLFHLIDLAVINSWLIWRKCVNSKDSLAKFKEDLGFVLCKKKGFAPSIGKGRKAVSVQSKINKKKYKPKTIILSEDIRLDRMNHWPENVQLTRNCCKFPECKQKNSIKCSKCNVFLCLNLKNNCFTAYHTN